MPRAGFYNDNEYRAYPFVFTGNQYYDCPLPDATIVDAGIVMDLMSGFDPELHNVWLSRVSRAGNTFTFTFHTNAPGAANDPLIFTRDLATEWQSEHVTEPEWEGFVVTGPLTALAELLNDGDELVLTNENRRLEPARIQSLVKSYLRSISLGNRARLMYTHPNDEEGELANQNRPIIVNAANLQGNLRIKPGYNCRVQQVDFSREIRVGVALGDGQKPDEELCDNGGEVRLYPEEPIADDSFFLSGGPSCAEVISTINGVGGANLKFVGGPGVTVVSVPEDHKVIIRLDNNELVGNCKQQ